MSNDNPYGSPADSPQNPYGQQPYTQQQSTQPWPAWLTPAGYGGAPGTRTLASPIDRLLARLIDLAVLLIPVIVLSILFAFISSTLGTIVSALVVFGYEAAMLLTQNQQTIGKKAMKLRVVSLEHGGRPEDGALWMRAAVYGLPSVVPYIGSLFALLNVLWQLWDKPFQQCLHDKPAKTVVVKEH